MDVEILNTLQIKMTAHLKNEKKDVSFINEQMQLIVHKIGLLESTFSCKETCGTILELLRDVNPVFLFNLFNLEDEIFIKKINTRYHQISRYKFINNKSTEYLKFIIISSPRSGSNYLKDMLSSHSQTNVFSEIFNETVFYADNAEYSDSISEDLKEKRNNDPLCFLKNYIFKEYPAFIKACGFKLFYKNTLNTDFGNISDLIFSDPEIRFIHLKRKNKLAQYFSYKKAISTNSWYNTDSESKRATSQKKLFISKPEFERYLVELDNQTNLFDKKLSGHNTLDIYYEDLLQDQNKTLEQILNFLHLENEPLLSTLQKQNTVPLKESIKNYNLFLSYLETVE